ncbi:MAG: Gfo/Idh/MocA family oxidoreductase [Methylococcales bacterium]
MTSEKPIRFGLIGAGAIAQSYLQAFKTTAEGKLVGVVDIRPDAARAMAEEASCESFTSYQALIDKCQCDAVIVCTPPSTHLEIVNFLTSKGIHVLCEKPLALDSKSAKEMLAAAERKDVLLSMATKFRYVNDVIRAKSIVESGILGEIILFENAFTSRVDMTNRWNSDPKISGGGVLIDNGTHSVDLIRYFLGPIAEVQAVEGKRTQSLNVEDTVRIFVRTEKDVMGSIDLSWSLNKELDSYIDIYGSQGVIRVGWGESKYRQASSQDWVVFGTGYNKVQAFTSQIENFSRAIHKKEPLLTGADSAIASVEVIEAAYQSMKHNDWMPVKPSAAVTGTKQA